DYNSAHYSKVLAEKLSQRVGQPVKVADLQLSWNWHGPALRLDDFSIKSPASGRVVVHASHVDLHFALIGLIRGQLLPDGIVLAEPRITISRDSDGNLTIRGLPENLPAGMDAQHIGKLLQQMRFIQIADGRIKWAGGGPLHN